ncbi:hypothetical protein WA026_000967 [Henosepilachna vigintioctopunctata]|uniref:JmjC domain-containing protein n=1 Tax=Henosepilachna vigintioctopunctata TaxID=420089 RepID=A0AAW1V9P7_9CUCU
MNDALSVLYHETNDFLHVPFEIAQVDVSETLSPNWALTFHKSYVSKNKPLIIKNGCTGFSAYGKWSIDYFKNKLSDKLITVAVTPNGYADGIANYDGDYFVLPEEKTMKMAEFLDTLEHPKKNYVCYIQKQNSNLHDFPEISKDIGNGFKWATEAFGEEPDNINFWMGDLRAITSMHKDPYENIYCVIDGYKDFILISPTDLPYVPYKEYPIAKFENVSPTSFEMKKESSVCSSNTIKWIPVDPLDEESMNAYPKFDKARKYVIRVEKGDVLYLPSLWFHHVRQSHGCIAVNFWYDMDFDIKYCYYRMLQQLCKQNI